jgi:hypothetical protein
MTSDQLSENVGREPDRGAERHGPLTGIRVLDVSTVYAAPITAMLLGDHGADVIKVEHPRGDPARTHGWNREGHGLWWKVISRNKRTVTLNLGKPEGQALLRRLVADADVLVENFRPGVMEKWGLGPDQLMDADPRLVVLRVTGFGQTGPYVRRAEDAEPDVPPLQHPRTDPLPGTQARTGHGGGVRRAARPRASRGEQTAGGGSRLMDRRPPTS